MKLRVLCEPATWFVLVGFGVVKRVSAVEQSDENSYDLDYEDGDSETRVPARLIRPLATAAPRDLIPTPLTTTSQAPPPADLETGGEL